MKRLACVLLCVLLLTSCGKERVREIPYGTWKCFDPDIIIYVSKEAEASEYPPYTGVYVKDGEQIEIFAMFNPGSGLAIFDKQEGYDLIRNAIVDNGKSILFNGTLYRINDTLELTLFGGTEMAEYEKLVFEPIR